jgi:hypothetical protein
MNGVAVVATALAVTVVTGCGGGADPVKKPFTARPGVASGPSSGAWGDGSSGPDGMQIGCIEGRQLAVLVTIHNHTKRGVELVGGGGPEPFPNIIKRVAVQVRLAPPPSTGRGRMVIGLRSWNPHDSPPVEIPAGRDGWVQSNFLMGNCALLRSIEPLTVNRSLIVTYSADGAKGTQPISVQAARIILTRGPLHPSVPINQVG